MQNVHETQLALGNGYVGSRAILEEIPPNCRPGTFFAGLYEGARSLVSELVNAPNPIDFRISIAGEKLGVTAMDIVSHKRILDMYRGILTRRTTFANARKKRFDYQSMRFFSMHDKNMAVMQIYITPLDEDASLTFSSAVDTSITNMGLVTEGEKKHVNIVESKKIGNAYSVSAKTIEKGIFIVYARQVIIKRGRKSQNAPHRTFTLDLKKGETACITNYLFLHTSQRGTVEQTEQFCAKAVAKNVKKGFEQLYREHCGAWKEKWKHANIEIDGDPAVERAVRFNIYHLLIAATENCDDVSIGAKALTGEGYRGHVFWDTEIFCLPFFIYTNPLVARNLLLYRYNRLGPARYIAKELGFQGAMFPWESADTGEETTPSWFKDGNGKIQRVLTMEQEHHITADIAFAVFQYYQATNDVDFLLDYGLEIMLEAARFWASRAVLNRGKKRYDIKRVIGPDEFHENVNNNAYTNFLAQWNLATAAKLCKVFQRAYPARVKALMAKINVKASEITRWRQIAAQLFIPRAKDTGVIEQFEGYFKRKKMPPPELNHNAMPLYPTAIGDISKTQYVKQSDVVMILFLLSDLFSLKTKKTNYAFYEKKTLHNSSLSASIHAALGAEVGEEHKAHHYLEAAAYADLKDVYGNTDMGVHAASLGGVWMACVHGFAGVRIKNGMLTINPKLLSRWKSITCSIKFKGFDIVVHIDEKKVSLSFDSKKKTERLPVRVYGIPRILQANKKISFYKKFKKKVVYDTRGLY